ncbi:odorant receptor 46a [Bactrocera tryoni]|uniref:odorant receptor 46a n=1 Tax=Bactrocera tryoni TaxID=59916 RepID=UPI001A9593BC|nr:odorant receptor 46a [Bactrocera tryoni]
MENAKGIVYSFYNIQLLFFKLLGLFGLPAHYPSFLHYLYKLYFWYVAIFGMLLFDISMWIKIIGNISNLNEIIKVFYLCSMAIAVMAKFVRIRLKNSSYVALFERIHNEDLLPVNVSELEKFTQSSHLSCRVRNSYMYLSLTSLSLIFATQLISEPGELPLSIYIPISVENFWCYLIAYLFQFIGLSLCCLLNISFDSLSASFFIYLKGQLDILANRLENIGKVLYVDDNIINLQLRDCIQHYVKLRKIAEIMEDLLSIPMTVQMISSVLVLVANFYAMTFLTDPSDYGTFMKFLVYQLCMLSQIFMLCYFANEVSLRSAELSYSLYSSEWTRCSKINRRLMLLMMAQLDVPIRIKTINRCYSFNLPAFTSIINSSYSYYALLKKMKD